MPKYIDTSEINLSEGKVGIVVALYNRHITKSLEDAAIETFKNAGIADQNIVVVHVPGAWEIPAAINILHSYDNFDGFVGLGAVIKGDTTHDQYINQAVSAEMMKFSCEWDIPVGFGLLTCNNVEQALERSGGSVGNKGEEAAQTIVEMMKLAEALPPAGDF